MVVTRMSMAGPPEDRADHVGMGADAPMKAETFGGMKSMPAAMHVMTPAQMDAAHGRVSGKASPGK